MASEDPFKSEVDLEKHMGDTDLSWDSKHHTLGKGATQAATGNHKHSVKEITDLAEGTSHDHTGTYAPAIHVHSGSEHSHSGVYADAAHGHDYAATGHGHTQVGNSDTVDGQHFNWDDRGHVPTYLWGVSGYGDSFLVWTGRISQPGHGHQPSESGIRGFRHGPFAVNAASEQTFGPFGKNGDEHVVHSLQHSSAYLIATMDNYTAGSYYIKIRNTTTSTNHSNIYVHCIHMRAA